MNDSFGIATFKVLFSIISLVIMFPFVENIADLSFIVTLSVFAFGKLIDFIPKIYQKQFVALFVLYIAGIIVCMCIVVACFFDFASQNAPNTFSGSLGFNQTLLAMTSFLVLIDVVDFVVCICKFFYTKKKLHQL